MTGQVRLAGIRDTPLQVHEVAGAVSGPTAGGLVAFVGVVRDHDGDRAVTALEYSAHPTAAAELDRVLAEVAAAHPGVALAAVHRVGELVVGDLAVVVAAAAAHRGAAFRAAEALIDQLKAEVPIWKRQTFADGGEEWVGVGSEPAAGGK